MFGPVRYQCGGPGPHFLSLSLSAVEQCPVGVHAKYWSANFSVFCYMLGTNCICDPTCRKVAYGLLTPPTQTRQNCLVLSSWRCEHNCRPDKTVLSRPCPRCEQAITICNYQISSPRHCSPEYKNKWVRNMNIYTNGAAVLLWVDIGVEHWTVVKENAWKHNVLEYRCP